MINFSQILIFINICSAEKIAMYIRVIDSGMVGYGVQHFEVIPSMLSAIKKGLITIDKFNQ